MSSKKVLVSILVVFRISLVCADGDGDGSSVQRLYDAATFEEEVGSKDHFVKFFAPWCGHCKKLAPVWDELSAKYNKADGRIVTIAKVDCTVETKLCSEHGVTGYPTLKFYRGGQEPVKYKGKREMAMLDKFIQEQLNPPEESIPRPPEAKHGLYELTEASFKSHVAEGSHFVKFYAPWCGHCKRLAPTWEELAQGFQHSDIVTIAKIDCTAHRLVCEQYGIKGYPTLKFFKDGEVAETYRGNRDHASLKEFVTKMTAERDAPPIPETEVGQEEAAGAEPQAGEDGADSKVVVLTTDNFAEKTASGISFIEFYAPWCPHCQKLAPNWEVLAKSFHRVKGVMVAKIDCTTEKDLCHKHAIESYPTLLLFQDGKLVEKHSGARSISGLENYLTSKIPRVEL